MGNETHIKWLFEGKTNWNARRESQEFILQTFHSRTSLRDSEGLESSTIMEGSVSVGLI